MFLVGTWLPGSTLGHVHTCSRDRCHAVRYFSLPRSQQWDDVLKLSAGAKTPAALDPFAAEASQCNHGANILQLSYPCCPSCPSCQLEISVPISFWSFCLISPCYPEAPKIDWSSFCASSTVFWQKLSSVFSNPPDSVDSVMPKWKKNEEILYPLII